MIAYDGSPLVLHLTSGQQIVTLTARRPNIVWPIRVQKVEQWDWISNEDLIEENGKIYDHFNRSFRTELSEEDVLALPLTDDQDEEIRVYNIDGDKIARRSVDDANLSAPCGVMINLLTINQALQNPDDLFDLGRDNSSLNDEDETSPQSPKTSHLSVYPQAYLRTIGHFQAKGSFTHFNKALKDIGERYAAPLDDDDNDDEDDDADYVDMRAQRPLLRPISTQAYNHSQHRLSSHAGAHDCQAGDITAALAGSAALDGTIPADARVEAKAQNARLRCKLGLPHNRLANRLAQDNCPSDLRLEVVVVLDMDRLSNADRRGQ